MSTLDGPIWSRCRIALTCPASHISSTHRAGKDVTRVWMNVTAHQEKKKNKETKTGRRRAGEKRKQATDFKEAVCCLLPSFRGQHSEKMKGSARGNWDPREVQQPFRPNPNEVGDRITTLRRLLIGAEHKCSLPLFIIPRYF